MSKDADERHIVIQRYDRLEARYLTTGDFSALQQMNTEYPMETRTLIEHVLDLGSVFDNEINSKLLKFYQDTLLQSIISEVEVQYADMNDVNEQLEDGFDRLREALPQVSLPTIYTQIGALNQSVVIGDGSIGISLDKYLGEDYAGYRKFYNEEQRKFMTRKHIVPDCLSFYLLSVCPIVDDSQQSVDFRMEKVQWCVNQFLDYRAFDSERIRKIDRYMKTHKYVTIQQLIELQDYKKISG